MRKVVLIFLTVALSLTSVSSQAIEPKALDHLSTPVVAPHRFIPENSGFKTIVLNSKNRKLTVGNAVVITYPTSVKLKKKGCQNIPISYKTYLMDDYDYVWVGIANDADDYLGTQWVYETPWWQEYKAALYGYEYVDDGVVWKKSGKAKIKICREDWVDEEAPRVGATKGNFQLVVETDYWEGVADIKLK